MCMLYACMYIYTHVHAVCIVGTDHPRGPESIVVDFLIDYLCIAYWRASEASEQL